MNGMTYGLDIAKRVFQLYWVEPQTGKAFNRRFGRQELIEFLSHRESGRIALEACGSAHYWARQIQAMQHEVILLHAAYIRPFVQTNKTDAADARAIWTAAQQPGMPTVVPKTAQQQTIQALHCMRSLRVKTRTMLVNQLRGTLFEFGIHFKAGRQAGLQEIRHRLHEIETALPPMLFDALREQLQSIDRTDQEIDQLEQRMASWYEEQPACKKIADIPGIGMLTATALVASIGDARTFKSGRELAAFLGLVPRQNGTGGKVRLSGISKRGDPYLRTLLIHGARSVLFRAKHKTAWCESLARRRPANVVAVAIANKMVRTVWALLVHDRTFKRDYVSVKPA